MEEIDRQPVEGHRDDGLTSRDKAIAGVLLLIPLLALLIVPIYARGTPEVLGFPFFYWYQLIWVFFAAALTHAAYVVIQRARRRNNVGGRP
jgi:Protein of unknown function (DUF3311)